MPAGRGRDIPGVDAEGRQAANSSRCRVQTRTRDCRHRRPSGSTACGAAPGQRLPLLQRVQAKPVDTCITAGALANPDRARRSGPGRL